MLTVHAASFRHSQAANEDLRVTGRETGEGGNDAPRDPTRILVKHYSCDCVEMHQPLKVLAAVDESDSGVSPIRSARISNLAGNSATL